MTPGHSNGHSNGHGFGVGAGPSDEVVEVAARIRGRVAGELSAQLQGRDGAAGRGMSTADRRALAQELVADALRGRAQELLAAGRPLPPADAEAEVRQRVLDGLFGLGGLQPLLDDEAVENIDVNGADTVFVRYADGRREKRPPVAASDQDLVDLIRTVAARAGIEERRFDRSLPRLSLQLPDGSRLHAVMAVTSRPSISIRRHRYPKVTLTDLTGLGTVSPPLQEFLAGAVRARLNIVVCGPTGVGKTTFLRALAAHIPTHERIITIEDSLELGLDHDGLHPDVVAMQTREQNIEGEGAISAAELVRWALRMSPDRVLVGESRGDEVVPMLNVMSQGNDGSMTTLHASSSAGAFQKIATYAAQSPERLPLDATALLVAAAVHLVVHLSFATDGTRVVSSVREVTGSDGLIVASNEVWRAGPDGRAVPGTPVRAATVDTIHRTARVTPTVRHLHDTTRPSWPQDRRPW